MGTRREASGFERKALPGAILITQQTCPAKSALHHCYSRRDGNQEEGISRGAGETRGSLSRKGLKRSAVIGIAAIRVPTDGSSLCSDRAAPACLHFQGTSIHTASSRTSTR